MKPHEILKVKRRADHIIVTLRVTGDATNILTNALNVALAEGRQPDDPALNVYVQRIVSEAAVAVALSEVGARVPDAELQDALLLMLERPEKMRQALAQYNLDVGPSKQGWAWEVN